MCFSLNRLHRFVERIGDSTPEDGVALTVQCFQCGGSMADGNVAGGKKIHIKDEFRFRIRLVPPFDDAGACVDFCPATLL